MRAFWLRSLASLTGRYVLEASDVKVPVSVLQNARRLTSSRWRVVHTWWWNGWVRHVQNGMPELQSVTRAESEGTAPIH